MEDQCRITRISIHKKCYLTTETQNGILYKCPVCSKTFKQKSHLMSHKRIHNEDPRKLQSRTSRVNAGQVEDKQHVCTICQQCFTNTLSFYKHYQTAHQKQWVREVFNRRKASARKNKGKQRIKEEFKCQVCKMSFANRSSCERHKRIKHLGHRPYGCPSCCKKFSRGSDLLKHQRNGHNMTHKHGFVSNLKDTKEMQMKNEACCSSTSDKSQDELSFVVNSDAGVEIPGVLAAKVNNSPFNEIISVKQPLKDQDEGCSYKCLICKEIFSELDDLRKHVMVFCSCRSVLNSQLPTKVFDIKLKADTLQQSINPIDINNKICSLEEVKSESVLDYSTEKLKPICNPDEVKDLMGFTISEMSGKINRNSLNSKNHDHNQDSTVHLGYHSYKCAHCNKEFDDKPLLLKHYKSAHEEVTHLNNNQSIEETITTDFGKSEILNYHDSSDLILHQKICSLCARSFISMRSYIRHYRSVHLGYQAFKCEECEDFFFTKKTLEKHHYDKHQEGSPHCDINEEPITINYGKSNSLQDQSSSDLNSQNKTCSLCDRSFVSRRPYIRHYRSVHLAYHPFKCKDCDGFFFKKKTLEKHQQDRHVSVSLLHCLSLSKTSAPAKNNKDDNSISHTVNQASCQILNSPNKQDASSELIKCSLCELSFISHKKYVTHYQLLHLGYHPHKCKLCKTGFVKKKTCNRHERSCHSEVSSHNDNNFNKVSGSTDSDKDVTNSVNKSSPDDQQPPYVPTSTLDDESDHMKYTTVNNKYTKSSGDVNTDDNFSVQLSAESCNCLEQKSDECSAVSEQSLSTSSSSRYKMKLIVTSSRILTKSDIAGSCGVSQQGESNDLTMQEDDIMESDDSQKSLFSADNFVYDCIKCKAQFQSSLSLVQHIKAHMDGEI